MTIGRQIVNGASTLLSLAHDIAQLLHRGGLHDAHLCGQVAHAGHKAHPYNILNVNIVANEQVAVVVYVDDTHQTVAMLSEVVKK